MAHLFVCGKGKAKNNWLIALWCCQNKTSLPPISLVAWLLQALHFCLTKAAIQDSCLGWHCHTHLRGICQSPRLTSNDPCPHPFTFPHLQALYTLCSGIPGLPSTSREECMADAGSACDGHSSSTSSHLLPPRALSASGFECRWWEDT